MGKNMALKILRNKWHFILQIIYIFPLKRNKVNESSLFNILEPKIKNNFLPRLSKKEKKEKKKQID